ncbi:PIN domain-containing protein [Belnapia sp. T6]|uniref:PIN domain-containing protein n=1 Tax=Belnapia mucosa TaxID=2804532 RepID=A0ABS1UWN6_9PROT|nr:PIN domain-containing protein [Belnapia mucosa]MBL6453717.1 PIN domain-containing protein [Belnapia mucosa]
MYLFLDACILIYQVEAAEPFAGRVRDCLATLRQEHPGARIAVSELSRLECRVRSLRERQEALVAAYDRLFAASGLTVVPLSPAVIDAATVLRARHRLRTPDAIQAACCLALPAPRRFVTGDAGFTRLPRLDVVLV